MTSRVKSKVTEYLETPERPAYYRPYNRQNNEYSPKVYLVNGRNAVDVSLFHKLEELCDEIRCLNRKIQVDEDNLKLLSKIHNVDLAEIDELNKAREDITLSFSVHKIIADRIESLEAQPENTEILDARRDLKELKSKLNSNLYEQSEILDYFRKTSFKLPEDEDEDTN